MEHLIAAINPEISSATGAPSSQFQQQGKSQPMDDGKVDFCVKFVTVQHRRYLA